MTIGYDQLRPSDFLAYFEGCIVFHYDGDVVSPYLMGGFCEDPDGSRYAEDLEVCVYPFGSDTPVIETVYTLLNTPEWLMHRFPVGYLAMSENELINISVETNSRRMRKGTTLGETEYNGALYGESLSDHVPDALAYGLVNHTGKHYGTADIAQAIADVLSYGNNPAMRTNIPPNAAKVKANAAIKGMFDGEDVSVLVPSFDTAIVRHRSARDTAIVLHNGRLLGRLGYDKETNVVTLYYKLPQYKDKDACRIARTGIELLAVPMLADAVELE